MNDRAVTQSVWLIFWGLLLEIVDFWINGFDLLPDLIGLALALVGVFRLGAEPGGPRFRKLMPWVQVGAVVNLLVWPTAFLDLSPVWKEVVSLARFFALLSVYLFCMAMVGFARHWALEQSAQSWRLSQKLYFFLILLPSGAGLVANLLVLLLAQEPLEIWIPGGWELPVLLIVVAVILFAMIHLLVSLYRTQKEVKSASS